MLFSDKLRPTTKEELVGVSTQRIFKDLENSVKAEPYNKILFTGNSGIGKTTLAYMYIAALLDIPANEVRQHITAEINGSDQNGVDFYRDLVRQFNKKAMYGDYKIFFVDEVHQLSKEAQDVLLTPTENLPPWIVLICATSEPKKLKESLFRRFKICKLVSPTNKELLEFSRTLLVKNGMEKPEKSVVDDILATSNGNVGILVNLLQSYLNNAYEGGEAKLDDLMKVLLFKHLLDLTEVFVLSDSIEDYNSYTIKMCSSCIGIIRNGKTTGLALNRAINILNIFGDGLSPYTSPKISFHTLLNRFIK